MDEICGKCGEKREDHLGYAEVCPNLEKAGPFSIFEPNPAPGGK